MITLPKHSQPQILKDRPWPPPITPLWIVRAFKDDPVGTQTRVLVELLERAKDTEWGRKYGFEAIAHARDPRAMYRERVPVHTYDAIRADVDRLRDGAADIMWPGRFHHFAVSSGTASAGKIIPLSVEMLDKNRSFSLAAALSYFESTADPSMFFGKLLSIPGRIEPDPRSAESHIGEVSGLQFLFAPWVMKNYLQAVPEDILFMPHWEKKLDAIVAHTMDMDIRAIAMVPSWAIVLFRKLMAAWNARHATQVTSVKEVWPNLKVFFSGGVALSSYRGLIEQQFGGSLDFVESYGASEGFISFQDDPARRDMLLHLDNGVYFEFVPVDEPERRLSIAEVEVGVRYSIHVTTCSGLWCYPVGDVVRFTSVNPYRLEVAGRTNEMLDKYGEAVYGDEARQALEKACAETGARIRDYHIASVEAAPDVLPGHQWLIEFAVEPADPEQFAGILDTYLMDVNRHYVIRREAQAFQPPTVVPLPVGTFLSWLQATRDRVGAQSKVPRMSEDRKIADSILQISGNNP
ncbi:MAG: GH3 auxin-responsive promoter family protein [Rhodothermales bacterium]